MKGFARDPIIEKADGLFYHWDETWSEEMGPYNSRGEAIIALKKYCAILDLEYSKDGSCVTPTSN